MAIPIELDHSSRESLQGQLFEQLRNLILGGKLKPGTLIPASRVLAEQLGISRNTVLLVYDRLIAEGYLQARKAIGTYVNLELPETCLAATRRTSTLVPVRGETVKRPVIPFIGQPPTVNQTQHLDFDFCPDRIGFDLFPHKIWRRFINRTFTSASTHFTECCDPAGLSQLREVIAAHLGVARAISVSPEQIIITAGSQEGLNLAARLLVKEGTLVATENPCYHGAKSLFESYYAKLIQIPVDEEGLDVAQLPREGVSLLYVTPSHQFPLGFTLPIERRLKLLDWARRCGAFIIEDDYDSDFRYRGSPLTALMGLDDHGCVMYLGTFSKSMGAGLRLGYLVVPKSLIPAARTAKALLNNGNAWLDQATMADFIQSGAYGNHLRRMRNIYSKRHDCLIEALREHFGEVQLSGLESGLHLAWHLPESYPDASELRAIALRHGVGVYSIGSGTTFAFGKCGYSARTLVLGFSSLNEYQIRAGVRRMADVFSGLPADFIFSGTDARAEPASIL
ncbi:MocR-like pyridoxine biosynthesis transcription factor PdxR [Nitrosovibrio sp. Nv4]|uniref:MocR-like pyridoxine biosynthesis transcription factor PdxR n=1 Tax=Nitrosovibrio sp. Nv4 TaxID=1945880 RepID=UPI000BC7F1B6|nr:PLP-dependent aminotransferase family protein [Nitrosovibrio sp. Nv4]SOD41000.1 GntR family transcriptional regulator / MocR family aminotransferase [Nitrosovibrio sp. Nv4]